MVDWSTWYRRRDRVLVMGILNVTPDSFYDGGRHRPTDAAVARAREMEREGADIIDVGGESTRPGADPVSPETERARVLPVIESLADRTAVPISVDTRRASVAHAALSAGATIVNDVSALRFDPEMARVIADAGAVVILMHMKGAPKTMQSSPSYDDVVEEVRGFLVDRILFAERAGIPRGRIAIDPGIGFGKRLADNIALLRHLDALCGFDAPVAIGVSRKSFLEGILELPAPERLEGTIAANAVAIYNGADIIRVHDVKEGRRTADVAFRLRRDAS